jgi:flagellar assembly factor FliW
MAGQPCVITFPRGIPGLEEYKIFELEQEEECLGKLTCLENKNIGFILMKPQVHFPDYLPQLDLTPEDIALLEIGGNDAVDLWVILTLNLKDISQTTANLRAPLVMNPRTGKGFQLILGDDLYSSRQPLFPQAEKNSGIRQEGAVG